MVRPDYDCLGKQSQCVYYEHYLVHKKKKHCDYYENYLVHKKESWKHYEHYGSPKKFLPKIMNLLGTRKNYFRDVMKLLGQPKKILRKVCSYFVNLLQNNDLLRFFFVPEIFLANILRRFCLLSGVLVMLWWTRNDSSKVIGNCNGLHKILWWLNYPLWSYPLLWVKVKDTLR